MADENLLADENLNCLVKFERHPTFRGELDVHGIVFHNHDGACVGSMGTPSHPLRVYGPGEMEPRFVHEGRHPDGWVLAPVALIRNMYVGRELVFAHDPEAIRALTAAD